MHFMNRQEDMIRRAQHVITSYHEAGHAVMAMSTGFIVTEISSVASADGQGHVIWQQSQPTTNASHVASVMTYAAGMAADYIHWNNLTTHNKSELCLGGQSDHANAQEHLIALGHQSVFEDYLCLSIMHLKKPNVWRWVEFFAEMMMEIKVINGQDVLYKARKSIPKLSQEELELLWCAIERKLR